MQGLREGGDAHAAVGRELTVGPSANDPRFYGERGIAAYGSGDFLGAIGNFDEAIRLDPKYAAAYNNRGLAYSAKGDNDHAIADFTKAIRLDSKLANAYENRGRAFRAMGENDRAVRDLKAAIRLDPKLRPVLKALGLEP
jgi:tetratricopeptide (TPR) repeat protein